MSTFTVRLMETADAPAVSALTLEVFRAFEAPVCTPEGVAEFERYAAPEALLARSASDHLVLVATVDGAAGVAPIAGLLELREARHVSLLFVDPAHHRRGIARALWLRALALARGVRPGLDRVTVNASPYAVPVYERFGFRATEAEQLRNGLRFVPMAWTPDARSP